MDLIHLCSLLCCKGSRCDQGTLAVKEGGSGASEVLTGKHSQRATGFVLKELPAEIPLSGYHTQWWDTWGLRPVPSVGADLEGIVTVWRRQHPNPWAPAVGQCVSEVQSPWGSFPPPTSLFPARVAGLLLCNGIRGAAL